MTWVLVFASRGHFIGDHGVKYIQALDLWQTTFSSRNLVDPAGWSSLGGQYPYGDLVRFRDGAHYSIYSHFFAVINAVPVGTLGPDGRIVVALIATIATVVVTLRLGSRLGLRPAYRALVCVVLLGGTPFGFYAGQLQEHSLASLFVTTGLILLLPEAPRRGSVIRTGLAGVAFAAAATIRPECYCAVAVGGLFAIYAVRANGQSFRRVLLHSVVFGLGVLIVLVPYWVTNLRGTGVWDPLVAQNEDKKQLGWTAVRLLLGPRMATALGMGCLALLVTGAGLTPSVWKQGVARPLKEWLALAGVWCAVAVVIMYAVFAQWGQRTLTGVIAASPILVFASFGLTVRDSQRLALMCFVTGYVALVAIFDSSGTAGGLQLGSRYLLPVVPVMALLAAQYLQRLADSGPDRARRRVSIAVVVVAVSCSLIIGTVNWQRGETIARSGEQLDGFVRKADLDAVIARRPWESQLVSGNARTPVLVADTDLDKALGFLLQQGRRRIGVIQREPLSGSLKGGQRYSTVATYKGWLDLQVIVIE